MALTHKQQLFIKHYVISGNGAESAVKAGYSPKSAKTIAAHLIEKDNLRQLIEKERVILKDKLSITNEEIVQGLASIAKNEEEKSSDRHACYKTLAQINGMLKENTTNVAIFSNMEAEDKSIISKRLPHSNLRKEGAEADNH